MTTIDKKKINILKSTFRLIMERKREELTIAEQELAFIQYQDPLKFFKKARKNEIAEMKERIEYTKASLVRYQSVLDAIKKEGITTVTIGLPNVCWRCIATDHEIAYLMVSGIKKNATAKTDDDAQIDYIEKIFLEYERKMGKLIDDELKIPREDIENFLELYEEYIRDAFELLEIDLEGKMSIEDAITMNVIGMFFYIVYSNTGKELDGRSRKLLRRKYTASKNQKSSKSNAQIFGEIYREAIIPLEKCDIKEPVRQSIVDKVKKGLYIASKPSREKIAELEKSISEFSLLISIMDAETMEDQKAQLLERIKERFPEVTDLQDALDKFNEQKESNKMYLREIDSLISGLSQNGFTRETHRVIMTIFTINGIEPDYFYLVLSGIKKGIENRKENDPTFNNLDRLLFDYEKRLNEYIKEDMSIKLENLKEFLDLLKNYLMAFSDEVNIEVGEWKDLMEDIFVGFGCYVYYCQTGKSITLCDYDLVYKRVKIHESNGKSFHEAIELTIKKLVDDYFAAKTAAIPKIAENPYTKRILEFTENGVVARPYDIDDFRVLLEKTDLPSARKEELLAQMRNLLNRMKIEEIESKREALLEEILTDEERKTLQVASYLPFAKDELNEVESILRMLEDTIDEEDREFLIAELHSEIETLKIMTMPPKEEAVEEEIPKLIYYTEKKTDSEGKEVDVPRFKTSLASIERVNYKQVSSNLNKLLSGLTVGDREVRGSNLPYHIWCKGKEVKVFYTIINGVVVVIDAIEGETGFRVITNLVTSKEFQIFLKTTSKKLKEGYIPDAREHTKGILDVLDKVKGKSLKKKDTFTN